MPLAKSEHEIFAQALADGKSEYEAYMEAYPKATKRSARSAAPRLLANVVVCARVRALKEQNAEIRALSREEKRQILAEIARSAENRTYSKDGDLCVNPDYRARIAAIQEDNRMSGDTDDKPTPPAFNITFVKE